MPHQFLPTQRRGEKIGLAGDHGKREESLRPFHLPRDLRALTILFPSPPIYSLLSLGPHPTLKNPREPLRRREPHQGSYPSVHKSKKNGKFNTYKDLHPIRSVLQERCVFENVEVYKKVWLVATAIFSYMKSL